MSIKAMILNQTALVFAVCSLMPIQALAECSSDGGTGTGVEYANMVLGGEGGGNWGATNLLGESTATGAFQFTYGTLKELGYIDRSSRSVTEEMYGAGEWKNVKWTGLNGINSREDFLTNQKAQVNALKIFTERNLKTIKPDYSTKANGVPLTPGGVAYASHFSRGRGIRFMEVMRISAILSAVKSTGGQFLLYTGNHE